MQSSTSRVWFVLALFSLSVLVSCDSGGGTPEPDEPSELGVDVTGTVTSAENDEPIGGVSVEVLRADNGNTLASATTDTTGSYEATFTIEEPNAPDQIRLALSAEGFVDKEVSTGFQTSVTEDVTLEAASVEATVSGAVTENGTGDPIEGASVTGTRPDGGEQLFETTTSSDGSYEVTFEVADEPSEVEIAASADGFEMGSNTVAFSEEIAADFGLSPSTTQATASGTVTSEDTGDPIEGASVTGTRPDGGEQLFEATTSSDGTYEATFEVADEPSEVTIQADDENFESGEQVVSFGQQITTDFSLQPATTEVTVSGTVSDSSSSDPIEGATITGTRVDDGDQLFETSAASSGEYESSFTVDAPSAPNELRVEANADSFRAEEATVGFASSVSQDFELVKNRFSLDLSVDGDGSIETNLVSGDLSENGYLLGSEVEIEVLPNGENIFFGWSGDIDKSENPATIEITENTSATAEVGTPQDGLSLGIGLVQIGSTIDEASFSLSNDLPEEVIVTGFTLLDQNDTEVINTSDNLTIDPGDSSGFSVSFGIGPTPEEFEQYQTIWEFEFRGSTFEKEVVVGDVYSPSDPFSLDKSANMIELRVEE
ncbi:hypothetical protein GGP55_003176 [Salinibacter ruber]|uniref:carboxypeptidase-like regulatory domain-containing protein n=1 Tax=Salinibacter ruber TaxID=146919 RepID=UPI002169A7C4|nr:carboxypeptidase-like regulatory domain-containing protein [Salinibacter ruber]MCS3632558.1 hypothetical protein [Salinibacter ruber]